jgi:hypothetical protein
MKLFENGPRAKRMRRNATTALGLLVVASLLALTLARASGAAATAVPLGTAGSFAVLAGAGITNTGPTTVSGDVGTFPTTTVTGAGSLTINGTNHAGDGVTQQAKTDLVTAYNNAAAQGPTNPIVADLGGQSLPPGVYNSASSIGLTGALTLNGGGDPNAVFVFQAGSALTTASASSVVLTNGAQACNVFWQIGSSATLGTGSTFRGTVIALQSITVTTGVSVDGRVLARNGAVTLDTDTISRSTCAAAPAPTTTAATTTAATTTTAAPTPKPKSNAAAAKRAAAVKAARIAKAKRLAAAKSAAVAKATPKPKPKPAVQSFGFTG